MRADQWLVDRGYYGTRARAADAIRRGCVTVHGTAVKKPGQTIPENAEVEVSDTAQPYVSRSAIKLVAGLDAFNVEVNGRDCLDVGASTGGFTQVLLERGASRVCAVDVGHNQLHPTLATDGRVTSLEGINARTLKLSDLPFQPTLIVADVSFVSLTLIVPSIVPIAPKGADVILLFKPQFEVGREHIGKGGLVLDDALAIEAKQRFIAMLEADCGWTVAGSVQSPIKGGDGNQEYLISAKVAFSDPGSRAQAAPC